VWGDVATPFRTLGSLEASLEIRALEGKADMITLDMSANAFVEDELVC